MPLNIEKFTSHLQNILDKRNSIIVSDLSDEEKTNALAVFDKENDELNQSIDIYYRLVDFQGYDKYTNLFDQKADKAELPDLSPYAKVDQLPDLSPYMKSAYSRLNRFELDTYADFVSNRGVIPYGGAGYFTSQKDLDCNVHDSFPCNLVFQMNGHKFNFVADSNGKHQGFGASEYGSRSILFTNAILTKDVSTSTNAPLKSWGSPFNLSFYHVTFELTDGFFFIVNSLGTLDIALRSVVIKKSSNFNGGKLIRTLGKKTNVSTWGVILEDGLTWADIVDDITKINFIR